MAQTWLMPLEILVVRLAQLGQCQGLPRRAHVHKSHERGVGVTGEVEPLAFVPEVFGPESLFVFFANGVYYWYSYAELKRFDGPFADHDDFWQCLGDKELWGGGVAVKPLHGYFEAMFVPPNPGLQVSDIPGAATHEGGEIVPAGYDDFSASPSLHGDFEGRALVLRSSIQGDHDLPAIFQSSIFPPHSVGDFATAVSKSFPTSGPGENLVGYVFHVLSSRPLRCYVNNDTTWMSRRKQRKICGKPLHLPKADLTAERGEKIGDVDVSLRVPPRWPRPDQGSPAPPEVARSVEDNAKQKTASGDDGRKVSKFLQQSLENYEQNAPSRAIHLPCYQDSPLVTIADESSALVAALVASRLEAMAWNDFPIMGSFPPASRQALALAEYVDLLYVFAACTTAPRFPFVYGPATANISRADGPLKSIRIGMGASLADGGPARQEVRRLWRVDSEEAWREHIPFPEPLLTQQGLYGHESCGEKYKPPFQLQMVDPKFCMYTLSVDVDGLMRRNPHTGNTFVEELRKFPRQLSPKLIDLGWDMRRGRRTTGSRAECKYRVIAIEIVEDFAAMRG
ncbi:hypothetical protein DFH09DRAFT_1286393 [Mycena vulgaris]|nr:hypothetical protein DFH09DRAFT_1286393 [Mycena vulgaris]